jgi:hypothetical protein
MFTIMGKEIKIQCIREHDAATATAAAAAVLRVNAAQ